MENQTGNCKVKRRQGAHADIQTSTTTRVLRVFQFLSPTQGRKCREFGKILGLTNKNSSVVGKLQKTQKNWVSGLKKIRKKFSKSNIWKLEEGCITASGYSLFPRKTGQKRVFWIEGQRIFRLGIYNGFIKRSWVVSFPWASLFVCLNMIVDWGIFRFIQILCRRMTSQGQKSTQCFQFWSLPSTQNSELPLSCNSLLPMFLFSLSLQQRCCPGFFLEPSTLAPSLLGLKHSQWFNSWQCADNSSSVLHPTPCRICQLHVPWTSQIQRTLNLMDFLPFLACLYSYILF